MGGGPRNSTASRFIGRARELAEIESLLDDAAAGHGGLALLPGEAGAGKSALLQRLSQRASERDFLVAWGRCWEQPGSPPLWPWVQILRQVVATQEGTKALSALGEDAALVHDLLRVAPSERGHEEATRFIMFDAVSRVLADASAQRPILLIFDDVHAADRAALLLLRFVGNTIRAARTAVVAAHRPAEGNVEKILAEIAAEGRRIPVPPMTPEEAATLYERTSGRSISETERKRLVGASGGNALLISELALIARERPVLEIEEETPIDDAVRTTVRLRLQQLAPATRTLLTGAAVIGRDIHRALVAGVTGIPEEELDAAVQAAVKQGILVPTDDGWAFAHDLIRQVLYHDVSPSDRAVLHIRAADAIEQRSKGSEHRAAEIAHHLLRGTGQEVRDRAMLLSRRAGDAAMSRFAYENAESHYRDALRLLDPDSPDIVDVLLDVARAQRMGGKKSDGRATCFDAIGLAEKRGDVIAVGRALATLTENRYVSKYNVDEQVIAMVDAVLPQLPQEQSKLRSSLMALRAMELWSLPEHATRRDEAGQIQADIDAARRSGDEEALAHALRCFVIVAGPDDLERRIESSRELAELAMALGLPASELIARGSLTSCLIEKGDALGFDEELARLVARAERVSHPLHLWVARSSETAQAAIRCDFERVKRLGDEGMAFAQEAEYAEGLMSWTLANICIAEHRGTLADMEPYAQAGKDMAPSIPTTRAGLAVIAAETGRPQDAQLELGPLMPELETAPKTPQWLAAMGLIGRAAAGIGEPSGCKAIYELLLPYASRHHYIPMIHPVSYHGSIAHTLGRLASILDLRDKALNHLEHALELHRRIGTPAWTAWSEYELARLLLEGNDEQRSLAQALLEAATETADHFRLSAISQAIEGVEKRPKRTRTKTSLSLVAEGEYWSIEHGDRTFRMKAVRGLHYLSILLENPDREFHALDLLMAVARSDPDQAQRHAPVASDALLDPTAKSAYKRRIDELREEIDDAEASADLGRRELAQNELDFIVAQLSTALGLKGRDRTWSDPGERARVSVTKSLKRCLTKIGDQDKELAYFLDSTIDTGMYCRFKGSISGWKVSVVRAGLPTARDAGSAHRR